jgi:hypothetical protein
MKKQNKVNKTPKAAEAETQRVLREEFVGLHATDLEIINRSAEALSAEAEDVLRYQDWPDEGQI